MKKSFTLIELLISISIILLMAVVAIPYFNTYSAKTDLNAKAEEIKYFLETAYAEAVSPTDLNNGVSVNIWSDDVRKNLVVYDSDCYKNINSCTNTEVTEEVISLSGYGRNDLKVDGVSSNVVGINFLSPASDKNTYFCSTNWSNTASEITFELSKTGLAKTYNFVIHRQPFRVEFY